MYHEPGACDSSSIIGAKIIRDAGCIAGIIGIRLPVAEQHAGHFAIHFGDMDRCDKRSRLRPAWRGRGQPR